ncbi:MAG: hypothetical protein HFE75_12225 [Firmicutes bacterium]|nr:hypothetical protein [Bacillota bacterium]
MKEKDFVRLEQPEEQERVREDERQESAKKGSAAVFALVALLFFAVMCVTYFFELKFGKIAGTVALIVVALIIAGYLYRTEILEKLKRKK